MSARTVMATRAQPGRTPVMRIAEPLGSAIARKQSGGRALRGRCASLTVDRWNSHDARTFSVREARRALFGEGCDPLRRIHAVAELALVVTLDIQLLRQRTAQPLVNRLLGRAESAGRRGGELPRQDPRPRKRAHRLRRNADQPRKTACRR